MIILSRIVLSRIVAVENCRFSIALVGVVKYSGAAGQGAATVGCVRRREIACSCGGCASAVPAHIGGDAR